MDHYTAIHWPLMGGLLHLVRRGGTLAGLGPAQSPPRCTKCNSPRSVPTGHPTEGTEISTDSPRPRWNNSKFCVTADPAVHDCDQLVASC